MISILKIANELMTIQLTAKKKKILTNYHNHIKCKAFFYNVIYIMDDILFHEIFILEMLTVVIVLCDGQFVI